MTKATLPKYCDMLAAGEPRFQQIIDRYGYPPFWNRPNNFESLVHIILEQQVSLASALATLQQLQQRLGKITPETVFALDDAAMKACYVSRQKARYIRGLAQAITDGGLDLPALASSDEQTVRQQLTALKGIGDWTADIYLLFVLHRLDIFPLGDLAAVNALKTLWQIPKDAGMEQVMVIIDAWRPYRTIGTMLLWHYYLSVRQEKIKAVV